MTERTSPSSIHRATKATLALHHANFSLDGLKFHFDRLAQYSNPTGGGLDKIPLNTKAHTSAYFRQFDNDTGANPTFFEPAPWQDAQKQKPIFLRKKAQYQVADHLLGIGKKAYWTGSTGQSTLLGLDIDDHDSQNEAEVQANSEQALQLFVELTGLNPVPCKSSGGINAFLLCHKNGMNTQFTNETWHSVVRLVNAEARRRGLVAILECKGKARIFNNKQEYCGVQFKDPMYAANPNDEQIHAFWKELESTPVSAIHLHDLMTQLENKTKGAEPKTTKELVQVSGVSEDDLLRTYKGNWAKECRAWAINGLPCHDSLSKVVAELAKWLLFVELGEVAESDRVQQVADLLYDFCRLKHNGFSTRLNQGLEEEVKSQVGRIVESAVSRVSERGKAVFSKLQSQKHMMLVPLMQSFSLSAPLSSVKSTECCAVLEWLPVAEYRRKKAKERVYVPDDTPLPEALRSAIANFYKRKELRINKPTWGYIQRLINLLWKAPDREARLGIIRLKEVGFSNSRSRRHIAHLESMGLIAVQGYCPAAAVSKSYRLREPFFKFFANYQPKDAI